MNKILIPIGKVLSQIREEVGLSQTEVAKRMGLSTKSGSKYISRLEKGHVKKSFLETVLVYLDAIGMSWGSFFNELSKLRAEQTHAEIMSQVKLPADLKLQKKLDCNTFLYETKIKPPQNYFTKVDLDLIKQKIEKKVIAYLQNLQVKDELIPHCLNFAYEIVTADHYHPIIEKYCTSGISRPYLIKIINIVKKVHRIEEKKVAKKKPLRLEEARAMAVKYLRSRVKLESIEAEVSKILTEYNITDNVLHNSYMNFARECYGKIKKYYVKDPLLLKQQLADITRAWFESGLKEEILEKIKDKVSSAFQSIDQNRN